MINIKDLLVLASDSAASDIFIVPGTKISLKIKGKISDLPDMEEIDFDMSKKLVEELYDLANEQLNNKNIDKLYKKGEDDFSFSVRNLGRFRCSVYMQRNSPAAVIRIVSFEMPDPKELNIPSSTINFANRENGIILVTGPSESGKTTTQACLIDEINKNYQKHIITIENPIEFIHKHNKSIVSQREVSNDTKNYISAIKSALKQSPDVLLVGEIDNKKTAEKVIEAAEAGILVISSVNTIGGVQSIKYIADLFDENKHKQIRGKLSYLLKAVISQKLLPTTDDKMRPVFEIFTPHFKDRDLITNGEHIMRLNNTFRIGNFSGMRKMDVSILQLYLNKTVTKETALKYSIDYSLMKTKLDHYDLKQLKVNEGHKIKAEYVSNKMKEKGIMSKINT